MDHATQLQHHDPNIKSFPNYPRATIHITFMPIVTCELILNVDPYFKIHVCIQYINEECHEESQSINI